MGVVLVARCVAVLAVGALVGCAALAAEPGAPSSAAIIDGTASDGAQDQVVLLLHFNQGASSSCSGTLLAPNLVLTALHCVSSTSESAACDIDGNPKGGSGVVGADYTPNQLYVYTGPKRPDIIAGAKPAARGRQILHDPAKSLCDQDLALVLLDTSISGVPISQIRLDAPPIEGGTFTAVGWGVTLDSPSPAVRQQRPDILIDRLGPSPSLQLPVPPKEFLASESVCSGDSGGPALDTTSSAIVGVVSRGGNGMLPSATDPAAQCVLASNFYSRIDAHRDVILQAYALAGQEPWLEGGVDPRLAKLGEACATGDDCRSGLCGKSHTCTMPGTVGGCEVAGQPDASLWLLITVALGAASRSSRRRCNGGN